MASSSSTSRYTKKFLQELAADPARVLHGLGGAVQVASLVQYANHQYHTQGQPVMTDDLYDLVKCYLHSLDPQHPLLHSVGAVIADDDARKVRLPAWMGSMDKIKADAADALQAFQARAAADAFLVTDKLDGVSALLQTASVLEEDHHAHKLFSRGDGTHGQDVSHLVPLVQGIPAAVPPVLVRGELILSRASFQTIKHLGANARNMVAGIVNAKLPDLAVTPHVRFVAYSLLQPPGLTQSQQLDSLERMGFEVVHRRSVAPADLTTDVLSAELVDRRANSPYEVDGIVVSADQWQEAVPGKNPTWAFAFKSIATQEVAEVVVTGVEWNVSKDGYWKPVVLFEPVQLAGVAVRRATGFNAEFIHTNVLGPGARITVTRSGDVIPYIVSTLSPAAAGSPQMPPEGEWAWTAGGKDARVTGEGEGNEDMQLRQLTHFFDKLDIKGVSKKTVQKLYEAGFKTVEAVLLDLTPAALQDVAGVSNRAVLPQKIQEAARAVDAVVLMQASNAFGRGFGERRLQLLADAFPRLLTDPSYAPTVDQLLQVDGISHITAEAFLVGLAAFRRFLEKTKLQLCVAAAKPDTTTSSPSPQLLAGQSIVFTGFRSAELEARVKQLGGMVGSAISKKNTSVVVTKDPAIDKAKLRQARELGIPVMSVDQFKQRVMLP